MSWHVDKQLMVRYLDGDLDRILAASVEMHVTACGECRGLVAVSPELTRQWWERVQDRIQSPVPTWLERVLLAVGLAPSTARVVAVSPSLRLSWFGALALVLLFAVAMTHLVDTSTATIVFGAVTPVLPVAGVALTYGRLADPSFEIVASTPVDRFRLLLMRVIAVTTVTLGLSLLIGLLLPDFGFFGLWILPALALTGLTLMLSSRFDTWKAAAVVTAGWTLLVVQTASTLVSRQWLFGPDSQPVFGALVVVAAIGVVARRDSFNRGGVK